MNRLLIHGTPRPCPHCQFRAQAERLEELCEQIEETAAAPRTSVHDDDDDDDTIPVIGIMAPDAQELEENPEADFHLMLKLDFRHLKIGGDLRQHTIDECRRVAGELMAAAERLEVHP